jgi:hypothetical protein
MAWSRGFWPVLGITYIAAGAAHFGVKEGFLDMYPHKAGAYTECEYRMRIHSRIPNDEYPLCS